MHGGALASCSGTIEPDAQCTQKLGYIATDCIPGVALIACKAMVVDRLGQQEGDQVSARRIVICPWGLRRPVRAGEGNATC